MFGGLGVVWSLPFSFLIDFWIFLVHENPARIFDKTRVLFPGYAQCPMLARRNSSIGAVDFEILFESLLSPAISATISLTFPDVMARNLSSLSKLPNTSYNSVAVE